MKTLFSVLVVLAIACPLYADTVVFQENFDGTAGTAIDGWNGWGLTNGAAGEMKISSAAIDLGNCAAWTSTTDWPIVAKGFTPVAASSYVLSATLLAPTNDYYAYSDLRIKNSQNGNFLQIALGYKNFAFGNGADVQIGTATNQVPTTAQDVKMVITDNSFTAYYREHGTSTWIEKGSRTLGAGYSLSGYDTILQGGQGTGSSDSILLTAVSPVPEPASLALGLSGLIGLLAYAWRKRR